jgi:DNA (cytosine-5)-methyltransferase 1
MVSRANVRSAKLDRIRNGAAPRLLELCSGCGGLSLGMSAAGFELVAHVEVDATTAESYALNFRPPPSADACAWKLPRDMEQQNPDDLVADLKIGSPTDQAFDVLAAGLPCQAFARIGRSKLRSLAGDEDAYRNDPRAKLYKRFLEYVDLTQPIAVIIENVPDILNFGGHNVPEEICETLEGRGYWTGYTLLNSAFYGVPQMRERLFLIAIDRSLGIHPSFPLPTHQAELPSGYDGARAVALKYVPVERARFVPTPVAEPSLPTANSVRAALADLPYISEHYRDPAQMRRRKVSDTLPYREFTGLTEFQHLMRDWPGFETGGQVSGNNVRITPRDFEIFRKMPKGADYPCALKIAEGIFEERLKAEPSKPRRGSVRWKEIKKACIPPYDPDKFPNKWWKLDPAFPSRTLTAHMGKDTYSHIHWDSRQQRTISVREAARLQSFPDGFRLSGAMNSAFRQIGNAVPPLLGFAVARQLKIDISSTPPVRAGTPQTPDDLAA